MKPVKGTVVGIDRTARTVRFKLPDDPDSPVARQSLEAAYLGSPPWPLATALFINGPAWVCLGPVGDRRLVVHDDFCGETTPFGDTEWTETGTGSISFHNDPGDGAAGVVDINGTTSGQSYRLRKHNRVITLGDDAVTWISARVALDATLLATHLARVGAANTNVIAGGAAAASDAGVYAFFSYTFGAANVFGLEVVDGTSISNVTTGETITAGTYYWVDIVCAGGSWAALWVDGSGPWIVDTNVPGESDQAVTPFAGIYMNSNAAAAFSVDQIRAELVTPVQDPQAYAEAPATSLSFL